MIARRASLRGFGYAGFGATDAGASGIGLPNVDVQFDDNARSVYVYEVQQILAAHGYDPGPLDGTVNPPTVSALSAALDYLAHSLSPDARNAIASSGSTASGLAQSLTAAFAWDSQVAPSSPAAAPAPNAPEAMIAMGPADAAQAAKDYGLADQSPAVASWLWLGFGVVAIGGAVVLLGRR